MEVVENDLVPRDDHSADQTEEPPVLNVDSAIGVWLVGCLLDQLKIELIAQGLSLQTFLYGQLHHGNAVVRVHLIKATPTRGGDPW